MKTHDTDAPDYQKLLDDEGATVFLCDRCDAVINRKATSSRRMLYILAAIFVLLEVPLILLAIAGIKSLWLSHRIAARLDANEYPMDCESHWLPSHHQHPHMYSPADTDTT